MKCNNRWKRQTFLKNTVLIVVIMSLMYNPLQNTNVLLFTFCYKFFSFSLIQYLHFRLGNLQMQFTKTKKKITLQAESLFLACDFCYFLYICPLFTLFKKSDNSVDFLQTLNPTRTCPSNLQPPHSNFALFSFFTNHCKGGNIKMFLP